MSSKAVLALLLSIVCMAVVAQWQGLGRYQILPPEEGLSIGVYGWRDSLYGTLYSAKNVPTPPPEGSEGWQLVNDDPHSFIFGYWHTFSEYGGLYRYWERTDVRVEVGQPYYEKYQDIEYYIPSADGGFTLIRGEVWLYRCDLAFSIVGKPKPDAGIYVYHDIPVWFAYVTNVWDRAVTDPTTKVAGRAWGAPISVYVEGYKVADNSGGHASVEPSLIGRFVTLYAQPDSAGATIDDLGIQRGDVNATLAGNPSPDSRMTGTAYARWILADFGPDTSWGLLGDITSQKFPSVSYKVKVYYLSVGKWTFTKEKAEEWEQRRADERLYGWTATWVWMWDSIFNALGMLNPFRTFGAYGGLVAFIAFAIIGFIIFYMLLTIVLPLILAYYGKAG